jgi:hypothetical protein
VRSESNRVYDSPASHRRRALWASARQLEHMVSVQPLELKHRLNAFTNAAEHGSDTGGTIDEEPPSSSSSWHACPVVTHRMSAIRRSARPNVCSMCSAFLASGRSSVVRLGPISVSVKFGGVLSGNYRQC